MTRTPDRSPPSDRTEEATDTQGATTTPERESLWDDEQGIAFQTMLITGVLVAIAASVGAFLITRTRQAERGSGAAVDAALAQISNAMASVTTT